MVKLTMAAAHSDYKPTVGFQHFDKVPDLHPLILAETAS